MDIMKEAKKILSLPMPVLRLQGETTVGIQTESGNALNIWTFLHIYYYITDSFSQRPSSQSSCTLNEAAESHPPLLSSVTAVDSTSKNVNTAPDYTGDFSS